jgi:RNA polymerase sigma factor (sigma-70 family)
MLRLIRGARTTHPREPGATHDELAMLASAVVHREPGAARSFVIATGSAVRGAVRMVLGSAHVDVEDATQDAMLGILQALPRFRGECTVTQFAVRIAVFTAMAVRRRQSTRDRWVVSDRGELDGFCAGPESLPLAQVEAARRREAVRRLLDTLPESIGEALALYFMLGYTVPEIAAAVQVPVNTIWSRLRIGRERVRRTLLNDVALSEELVGVLGDTP